MATAVPTDNPTFTTDLKVTAEPVPTGQVANPKPTATPQFQVYNVGDTVRLGDLHVTVNSVRASLGEDFFTPEEGKYFIYVDVTFRNEGNKPEVVSTLLSMEIRDAEGRSYDVDLSAVAAAGSPSPDGEIAPGDTIRGEVGFQLPVSATDLTWRFSGNLSQLGQAIFSLGNVAVPVPLSGSTLDQSPTPTVSQTPLPHSYSGLNAYANARTHAYTRTHARGYRDYGGSRRKFIHPERGKGPCSRRDIRCG